jgi:hypothetical protein
MASMSTRPATRAGSGEPVRNLWVLGPLAEGSCCYNHYVTSAGAPSRLFIDAHKAASAILDTGTAHDSTTRPTRPTPARCW